jgi:hypothetical protein
MWRDVCDRCLRGNRKSLIPPNIYELVVIYNDYNRFRSNLYIVGYIVIVFISSLIAKTQPTQMPISSALSLSL